MSHLDLHDIQGGIVKSYGRYGFPKAYFFLLTVTEEEKGRAFLRKLVPSITTSTAWASTESGEKGLPKPVSTTNVAFSYRGLHALGVPRDSLQSFPDEFAMGMQPRHTILGDDDASAPEYWDPVWRDPEAVHIMVWINGQNSATVEQRYQEIVDLIASMGSGVEIMKGHRGKDGRDDCPYQDASAIYQNGEPTPREHFGYVDGISDPFFKGISAYEQNVMGGGKVTGADPSTRAGWKALETGEFLLGHKDESLEWPEAPDPALLARNGTYVVYRKLHQNVGSFDQYLDRVGRDFPGGPEALAAKFAGRWRNGAPLSTFPTEQDANDFAKLWAAAKSAVLAAKTAEARSAAKTEFGRLNAKFTAYDYRNDLDGGRCPFGSHVRRANPRSALEFGQNGAFETPGAVSNRRRILRRGLPYGDSSERRDEGEHGVVFMALNASIRRQFEFVQQQWINYGNDFKLANEKDPLLGNHGLDKDGKPDGSMVIQSAASDPKPPFVCFQMPRFVEVHGGEYFFMPSLTALRMIGAGSIDPT
jgi:Dyp-type peroxidase family